MPKLLRIIKHLFRRFVLGRPHTVRILAAGPATRDECPADHEAELWSLNRFWRTDWLPREPDRWFEVHPPITDEIEADTFDESEGIRHVTWLKQDHDFPIYFLQEPERYPSGVQYPITRIGPAFRWYLTSSIAYMVAFAIWKGYDRIELYGVEMPVGSDYFHQRPNMLWLLGLAEGEFIDVYVPPSSSLMREPMYAFDSHEVQYDNHLRSELSITAKHANRINMARNSHTGVVQGIKAVIENFVEHVPDIWEDDRVRQILSTLLNYHKGQARKLEGAANVLRGQREVYMRELGYRNAEYKDFEVAVDAGGTDLEESIEFVEELKREDQ